MIWQLVFLVSLVSVALLARIFCLLKKRGEIGKKRTQPAATMIVLGSGGHTTEILQIVRHLSFQQYSPRVYVKARSDRISASKVAEVESRDGDARLIEISRSREVGQSYLSSVWTSLVSFRDSMKVVWTERPNLVLCNGPGTCVPICLAAFLLKLAFLASTKIIFVESFCRVKTMSLTGKILYFIADDIIVQWPQLRNSQDKHAIMCDIAALTGTQIPWDVLEDNLRNDVPVEMRMQLAPIWKALRASCETKESLPLSQIEDSLLRLEACLDQTWEALNTGYWKDVPIKYRHCYTLCSAMKCIFLEIQCAAEEREDIEKRKKFIEIIKQIDKAILLGAPLANAGDVMTKMASRLNDFIAKNALETAENEQLSLDDSKISKELLPGLVWIPRIANPSMETFYRDLFKPKSPAVLEGCLSHWKALNKWKDVNYLMKIAGNRTVPIEIGSRYTEEDWSQSLVTFAEFLRSHVSRKSERVGYLAQHQLFDQIPELKEDFAVPEYCSFSDSEDDATSPDINAWFGPRGTISPLHFDPKNNLLCQVFGCKRVILYRPDEAENLYAYGTRLLSNTAQVDPVCPDYEKWPEFAKAKGSMCYLGPGDTLFIPPGWWHHVESLTPSFSVSFWWR